MRGQGLGKAVVSALASWCLDRGVIPQYRCREQNLASLGVAQAVGFRQQVVQESVWPMVSAGGRVPEGSSAG